MVSERPTGRGMKILFVAADPLEYRGILDQATQVRVERLPSRFARSGRLGGHEALFLANGAGWKRAEQAVASAAGFQADAVVSTGFCGALSEDLRVADVVAATVVRGNGREHLTKVVLAPHRGVICSIDHVAQTASEKRTLLDSGACAVEMEAAGVAASAERLGTPFYCIRAVTDLAGETMANDFNKALRSDGHLDTMDILRGALRRPTSRIPELVRLRRRCVLAAKALGEFFVGCRF
jgi:nucleoside phosphorylase